MCDKLVYDLAQEVEGSPCVFIRKDWINILDNQNQSYVSNQSVLDTSQLSNSNKWMSYREAYFLVPMTITLTTDGNGVLGGGAVDATAPVALTPSIAFDKFSPTKPASSADFAIGLKNWYGNIIHSFTLDYNGSTIIQQTPFVNMWNSFKLMTSMSYQDILTQGCTIGFYPDNAESFEYYPATVANAVALNVAQVVPNGSYTKFIPGTGTCNNSDELRNVSSYLTCKLATPGSGLGNVGFYERQKWIAFDVDAIASGFSNIPTSVVAQVDAGINGATYASLYSGTTTVNGSNNSMITLWKNYITFKRDQVSSSLTQSTQSGVLQYAVIATVYLKHIHSFFNMIPLLKGVFMKMTMNLNNTSTSFIVGASGYAVGSTIGPELRGITSIPTVKYQVVSSVQSALGGVNMLMLASNVPNEVPVVDDATNDVPADMFDPLYKTLTNGASNLSNIMYANTPVSTATPAIVNPASSWWYRKPYRMNLSVGSTCLDNSVNQSVGTIISNNACKSIYLYIPAYTFNPTFEQAYLSSPVKQIKYTDIYQYQVLNISGASGQINSLLTNGIANIKSVLVLPYYSTSADQGGIGGASNSEYMGGINLGTNTGFTQGIPVYQSPFDPVGCGATSPVSHLTNFNIQVSGQNAIYNLQKYSFEQFNNQLYGQNAVNGGLTDGITSSLVSRQGFDLEYCYYYVNVERMLPVEQSVPKSIQLIGTNMSSKAMDYICFIEYGTEVQIDALTGARV